MAGERTLTIKILGDAAGGKRALNEVDSATGKTTGSTSLLSGALGDAKSKLLGIVPGGQQADAALSKMKGSSDGVGFSLKGAVAGGAAAAGVAIAGMLAQGVGKFATLTGEVTKYKNATGASSEEASKAIAVAHAFGVESDALTGSMFKSGASIAANADKFEAMGIAIAHNKDGTVDLNGTLKNAAEAYQGTADAATKDAIAKQIGGKRGQELIPILKATSEQIDEITAKTKKRGEIFSDKDLKQGKEYRRSLRELGDAGSALEITLARGVVPALTDMANGLSKDVDQLNSVTQAVGGLSGIIHGVRDLADPLQLAADGLDKVSRSANYGTDTIDHYLNKIPGISVGHKKQADSATDAAGAEQNLAAQVEATGKADEETAKLEADRKKGIDDLAAAQISQVNAELGVKQSNVDMRSAVEGLTDKQKALTDAVHDHGKKSAEAKAAQEDYDGAILAAQGTFLDAASKQADLAEQTAKAAGTAFDASAKHNAYRDALIHVKDTLAPGSPLRTSLEEYINELKPAGDNYNAQLSLDAAKALQVLEDFRNQRVVVPVELDWQKAIASIPIFGAQLSGMVNRQLNAGSRNGLG